MRILVTGFERFIFYSTNPSEYVARKLNGKKIAGVQISSVILPINFKTLPSVLHNAIKKHKPDILITLGLSFRNLDKFSIETIAQRKILPPFSDNYGRWPNNTKYATIYDLTQGKKASSNYKTTLPVSKIKLKLKKANIPVIISKKAGGYTCEEVFYLGRYFMEKEGLKGISGHIHLPNSPATAKDAKSKKFMSLSKMQEGVEIAIKESINFLRNK